LQFPVGALSGVIEALSLHDTIGGPHNVPTLAASLEINGAGIIIWDDFWRTVSRLMTGASLATILGQAVVEQEEQQENAAQDFAAIGVAAKMSVESDAAMALALSAQWDDMDNAATTNMTVGTGSSAQLGWGEMGEPSTAATFSPSAPTVAAAAATIPKSDEEIARELQAQWNDEAVESSTAYFGGRTTEDMIVYGGTSNDLGANTLDEHVVGTVGPVAPATATKGTASSYAAANQSIPSAEGLEDINGESRSTRFSLIYYNGLRGGQACRFTVTKSEEEAVGASVALAGQGTGGMTGSSSSSNWHKLEDIVRTRWPGCGLDWHGATPPSID